MENVNTPPTNNRSVLPAALRARAVQELHELQVILAFVDSLLESIEQFLNNFANQPNETNMNDLESDDESVDTPLVSPFPHSDNDLDDGEVLNELSEYENAGVLHQEIAINSFDGDDLAFQWKNLIAIVRDVYMFVGSFTYITDFVILEDIREFILINKAEVVMGKPFRKVTKLEYDCAKGLMSFNMIFDNYAFQMPRTIPRKFFKENEKKIFSEAGDGVKIYPDDVVIFNENKLGTCDNHDLSRLVKPLVLTYESVVMYGLCVYMRYVDCVRVGNQSIEHDRLIGIGLVMDLVKFLSFTFGGKEMTFVVLAFLR
ncbi:hypothetical protein Tco_1290972 [Tanacetum coccineum]